MIHVFTQFTNTEFPSCPRSLCSPKHKRPMKIRNYRQWRNCLSQLRDAWSEKFCAPKQEHIILNFPTPALPSIQTCSELHYIYVSCVAICNIVTTDYYAGEVWFSLETVQINNPLCPVIRTEIFQKQILSEKHIVLTNSSSNLSSWRKSGSWRTNTRMWMLLL
jgi:hypothetical protein